MEKREGWPVWGRLIDEKRDRMGISQNEAAKRAGMSGTNWRKIVSGVNGLMDSPRGLRTVARMAQVVHLDAGDLTQAGREDVAQVFQPAARREPTTAELLAQGHADMDAIEAELNRRWVRMWQDQDRRQIAVLLQTLRALQDK